MYTGDIITAAIFAFIIAVISYKIKFLSKSGSAAVFLLALEIYSIGTWKWTIPILTFFILSSILSIARLKKNENIEKYFEKSGVRDAAQVFANGGLAAVFAAIYFFDENEVFYFLYLGTIAAVCADTWGTELGTIVKTKTFNIINFNKIEQGQSGGVSLLGLTGSIAGALVIALTGIFWIRSYYFPSVFSVVIISGFSASLVDSILGASLQCQYRCGKCGRIIENKRHCGSDAIYFRGIRWMGNDTVNFITSIAGGFFTAFLYKAIIQ